MYDSQFICLFSGAHINDLLCLAVIDISIVTLLKYTLYIESKRKAEIYLHHFNTTAAFNVSGTYCYLFQHNLNTFGVIHPHCSSVSHMLNRSVNGKFGLDPEWHMHIIYARHCLPLAVLLSAIPRCWIRKSHELKRHAENITTTVDLRPLDGVIKPL